jgi:hypothetical protein
MTVTTIPRRTGIYDVPFVSVTDPRFGARGDGVTDDSAAINAAITAAKTLGLTLYAPPGTYRCKNLRLEGGTLPWSLIGAGKELTIFKHVDGNGTLMNGTAGSSVPYTLSDFTVDCQFSVFAHAGANHAISFADTLGVKLYRIRTQDYKNSGILGYASVANTFGSCEGHDCEAIGNGATTNNGLLFADMPKCKWVRSRGYNCLGSPGYAVQLKNDSRNGEMIDCVGDTCNVGLAFGLDAAVGVSRSKITGGWAYNCDNVFLCSNANDNSIHVSYGDANEILSYPLRFEGTSAGNRLRVDVLQNINALRSAVYFKDTAADNVAEIGVIDESNSTGNCVTFDAGTSGNSVVVHTKRNPAVHTSGIGSEATFNNTTTNSFRLKSYQMSRQINIAAGVVTLNNKATTSVILDTEGGAATDDLDTITADGLDGRIITLRTTNSARDVVVKHNTGNIVLDGSVDFTLTDRADTLMLIYNANSARWCEVGRGNNL